VSEHPGAGSSSDETPLAHHHHGKGQVTSAMILRPEMILVWRAAQRTSTVAVEGFHEQL
jgi:hypothetical protein